MKNNKGFALVWAALAIMIIGGAVYALVSRPVLKGFFEKGDKPTQQQFSNTIDSAVNIQDDKTTGLKEYNPTKEYTAGDTSVRSQTIHQASVGTQAQNEASTTGTGEATTSSAATETTQPAGSMGTSDGTR